jgi:hypothetical protein
MPVTPNSIVTPQTPKSATVVATVANTDYDDIPANAAGALITAGANGARVTKIYAIPRATVTATQLQLYRSADGGTTKRLFESALMVAYTMAATTEAPTTDFGYSDDNPLILSANEVVYPAIGVALAAGVVFVAEWADY